MTQRVASITVPSILLMVLLISGMLPLTGADTYGGSEGKRSEEWVGLYRAETIGSTSSTLAGGLVSADIDCDGDLEIVEVGFTKRVEVIEWDDEKGEWIPPSTIWQDTDALIDIRIADMDPVTPCLEMVTGGYSGNVSLLRSEGEKWNATTLWHTNYTIFGIAIGDYYAGHDGLEIVVVDATSPELTLLWDEAGVWNATVVPTTDEMRNVAVGDFDPAHSGEEIVCVGMNGTVFKVEESGGGWSVDEIWKDNGTLLDVAIGDCDPSRSGNEVLVVGFSGNVTMIYGSGLVWNTSVLWSARTEDDNVIRLEGITIGDFDPFNDGNEIAIGGYYNTITLIFGSEEDWQVIEIWEAPADSLELNGIVIGDFWPGHVGPELVVIGYNGVTTLLYYEAPGFEIVPKVSSISKLQGENVTFEFDLVSKGNFFGDVTFDVDDLSLPAGLSDPHFSKSPVAIPSSVELGLKISGSMAIGNYSIEIKGGSGQYAGEVTVFLEVRSSDIDIFEISIDPLFAKVAISEGGGDVRFTISTSPVGEFSGEVALSVGDVHQSLEAYLEDQSVMIGEGVDLVVGYDEKTPIGTYTIKVVGESGGIKREVEATLEVGHGEVPLDVKIVVPSKEPKEGEDLEVLIYLTNEGDTDMEDVRVELLVDGEVVDSDTVTVTTADDVEVRLTWKAEFGEHEISASVESDPYDPVMVEGSDVDVGEGEGGGGSYYSIIALIVVVVVIMVVIALMRGSKKDQDQ